MIFERSEILYSLVYKNAHYNYMGISLNAPEKVGPDSGEGKTGIESTVYFNILPSKNGYPACFPLKSLECACSGRHSTTVSLALRHMHFLFQTMANGLWASFLDKSRGTSLPCRCTMCYGQVEAIKTISMTYR